MLGLIGIRTVSYKWKFESSLGVDQYYLQNKLSRVEITRRQYSDAKVRDLEWSIMYVVDDYGFSDPLSIIKEDIYTYCRRPFMVPT